MVKQSAPQPMTACALNIGRSYWSFSMHIAGWFPQALRLGLKLSFLFCRRGNWDSEKMKSENQRWNLNRTWAFSALSCATATNSTSVGEADPKWQVQLTEHLSCFMDFEIPYVSCTVLSLLPILSGWLWWSLVYGWGHRLRGLKKLSSRHSDKISIGIWACLPTWTNRLYWLHFLFSL